MSRPGECLPDGLSFLRRSGNLFISEEMPARVKENESGNTALSRDNCPVNLFHCPSMPFTILMIAIQDPSRLLFFRFLFGSAAFAHSVYWLYLCTGEHWIRSIGSQNVVLLSLHVLLSFIALFFLTRGKEKVSTIALVLASIPGFVASFLNRAARFLDFSDLILAFNEGHPDDPAVVAYLFVYSEDFLQYEYIVSRSSTASLTLVVLLAVWMVTTLLLTSRR
jgi:hypothetical protein